MSLLVEQNADLISRKKGVSRSDQNQTLRFTVPLVGILRGFVKFFDENKRF